MRPKWCERERNLSVGDVVLVKHNDVARNEWPMGRVIEALKSEDGKVRKAKVMTYKDGPKITFRPVSEVILLLSDDGEDLENKDSMNKDSISLGEECGVH